MADFTIPSPSPVRAPGSMLLVGTAGALLVVAAACAQVTPPTASQAAFDLTPAPADQPQPRLELDQNGLIKDVAGRADERVTLRWPARNAGAAPLHLRLTPLLGGQIVGAAERIVPAGAAFTLELDQPIPPTWRGPRPFHAAQVETNELALAHVLGANVMVAVDLPASITEPYGPADTQDEKRWEEWRRPAPETEPQPKLVVVETTVEAEPTWQYMYPTASHTIRNEGLAPLRIQLDWTCAHVNCGPRGLTLEPGASTTVLTTFVRLSSEMAGQRSGPLVRSNDPRASSVALRVKTSARHAVRVSSQVVNFGSVRRDDGTLTAQYAALPWRRRPARAPDSRLYVQASADWFCRHGCTPQSPAPSRVALDLREITPGGLYELTVAIHPPYRSTVYETAYFRDRNQRFRPRLAIDVFASLEPRLTWDRQTLRIPADRSEELVLRCPLKWSDDGPPGHVLSITSPVAGISAHVEENSGQTRARRSRRARLLRAHQGRPSAPAHHGRPGCA